MADNNSVLDTSQCINTNRDLVFKVFITVVDTSATN
jgi:hypothetical protein